MVFLEAVACCCRLLNAVFLFFLSKLPKVRLFLISFKPANPAPGCVHQSQFKAINLSELVRSEGAGTGDHPRTVNLSIRTAIPNFYKSIGLPQDVRAGIS